MSKDDHDYIDRTILKLRREYSKDELVAALNKQLEEKDVEIGKLTAQVHELEDQLGIERIDAEELAKLKKKKHEEDKAIRKEIKESQLYKQQKEQLKNRKEEIKGLRSRISDQVSKIVQLNNQLEKYDLRKFAEWLIEHDHIYDRDWETP